MESSAFIDTNIFVNHLPGTHPEHCPASTVLLKRVQSGEIIAWITESVAFETIFTLERSLRVSRADIAPMFKKLLAIPNLHCRDKELLLATLDLWAEETPLSFADCYHLLYARHLGLSRISTFDRKTNRLPGVARLEP